MPSKLRGRGYGAAMLAGMVAGIVPPVTALAQLAPPPVNRIEPTLNVQALATSNSELAKGGSGDGKKELILSVTPGIGLHLKGAQSEMVGQFQLEGLRHVRASQPDRMLPSGDLRLKLEPVKDALGVEASVRAAQVRANTTAQQIGPGNTANSYTDTTVHAAPYARARLDAQTTAEVRVDRGMLDSTQNASTTTGAPANDAANDAFMTDDRVRVLRSPTPLGYELQLTHRSERYKDAPDPALAQRTASAVLLLAPDPEINVGLKLSRVRDTLLRTNDTLERHDFDKTSLGYQAQWRPTDRSIFLAETEDHSFGRVWMVDLQHRWRQVSIGLRAERGPTTYAREASRPAIQPPPLIAPPSIPTPGSTAPDQSSPRDTGAQLRQAIQGRMIIMGRRNELTLAGGFVKSAALQVGATGDLITGGRRTREYYFESQLTHQLTPDNSLVGALRWGRTWAVQPVVGDGGLTRDFIVRAAFNSRLTPDTTATMGLKRQITHNTPTTSANETAGYIGLGHRF